MKYLKTYEEVTTIKHTDEISVNHILRDFSRKFEDIIIMLKEKDNFQNSTVKRYFFSDGHIKIMYNSNRNDKLMGVRIYNNDEDIFIKISLYRQWYNNRYLDESNEFYKFVSKMLKRYKTESTDKNNSNVIRCIDFKIPLSEKEEVIDKLYEYKIKIESEKYNL